MTFIQQGIVWVSWFFLLFGLFILDILDRCHHGHLAISLGLISTVITTLHMCRSLHSQLVTSYSLGQRQYHA